MRWCNVCRLTYRRHAQAPPPPFQFFFALTRSNMQCFPVKSLVHKVLGGGGVYAYIRYTHKHRHSSIGFPWPYPPIIALFFEAKCLLHIGAGDVH
jgi:hypothetical protein